jgi:hypothetical protein
MHDVLLDARRRAKQAGSADHLPDQRIADQDQRKSDVLTNARRAEVPDCPSALFHYSVVLQSSRSQRVDTVPAPSAPVLRAQNKHFDEHLPVDISHECGVIGDPPRWESILTMDSLLQWALVHPGINNQEPAQEDRKNRLHLQNLYIYFPFHPPAESKSDSSDWSKGPSHHKLPLCHSIEFSSGGIHWIKMERVTLHTQ